MEKKNIALIGSPGHYFNLLECLTQLEINKKNTILILFNLTSDLRTNIFFDNYIDRNDWLTVKKIQIWEIKHYSLLSQYNLKRIFNYLFKISKILIFNKFNYIIVNQIDAIYYRLIIRVCYFDKIISLDEGNAIIRFIHERNNNKYVFKKLLPLPKKIIFFSSYEIKTNNSDELIPCKYVYSQMKNHKKEINNNLVFFIGSPFIEDEMISQEVLFQNLLLVKKLYEKREIVYISHRREEKKNLDMIQSLFGFKIVSLSLPIELYILETKKNPKIISGFYSAAILNLKKILQKSDVIFEVIMINPNDIKKDSNETIIDIYEEYKKNGINVILND